MNRAFAAIGPVAVAAVMTFDRVFTGWDWLIPMMAAAAAGLSVTQLLMRGQRLLGIWSLTIVLLSLAAGAATIIAVIHPEMTWHLLPTRRAVAAALQAASASWQASMESVSPVDPTAGYLTLSLAAVWVSGTMSAVLFSKLPLLSSLPWVGLFGYASAVGEDGRQRLYTALIVTAIMWLLYRVGVVKLPAKSAIGHRGLALRTGVYVLVGTFVLSSFLPGYGAEPLVPWASIGPSNRTELSPFVQLRPRLTQRTPTDLFFVTADQPAYWRLASLDRFDGEVWQIQGRFRPAGDRVRVRNGPETGTDRVRQRFRIVGLDGGWLPAAFSPTRLEGVTALFDQDLDTLLVERLRQDQRYQVVSQIPRPTFEELRAATAGGLEDPQMLALPVLSPTVVEETLRITSDAPTPYEKALAIQEHLRTFTYSTRIPAEHSADFLGQFLTELKAGYCEQFAAAMAVMLRVLGIPARVAVGFLPGSVIDARNGQATYLVTTDDAHAWPEAYFDGVGWVAFEPTPRALTRVPEYTVEPTAPDDPAPGPGGDTAPPPTDPSDTSEPRTLPPEQDGRPEPAAPKDDIAGRLTTWIMSLLGILAIALLLARALVLRGPLILRKASREGVDASVDGLLLRGRDVFRGRRTGETVTDYAQQLASALDLDRPALGRLLDAHLQAAFGPQEPGDALVKQARGSAKHLYRQMWLRASWPGRLRLAFSPSALAGPIVWLSRTVSAAARQLTALLSSIRASSAARRV